MAKGSGDGEEVGERGAAEVGPRELGGREVGAVLRPTHLAGRACRVLDARGGVEVAPGRARAGWGRRRRARRR